MPKPPASVESHWGPNTEVISLVCPFFARRFTESSGLGAEWDAALHPRPHGGAVLRVRNCALTLGPEGALGGIRRKVEIGKAFILPNQVGFGQRAGIGSCVRLTSRHLSLHPSMRSKAVAAATSKKR